MTDNYFFGRWIFETNSFIIYKANSNYTGYIKDDRLYIKNVWLFLIKPHLINRTKIGNIRLLLKTTIIKIAGIVPEENFRRLEEIEVRNIPEADLSWIYKKIYLPQLPFWRIFRDHSYVSMFDGFFINDIILLINRQKSKTQ